MAEKIKIYLIDKENETFDKLKANSFVNIIHIKNIDNALREIKKYEFTDMKIIIKGKLYSKFYKAFKERIHEINVIPIIVIFIENENSFKNENKDIIKEQFFQFCRLITSYEELEIFINEDYQSKKFEIQPEPQITFNRCDKKEKLALHLFYKVLIQITRIEEIHKCTNALYDKYQEKFNQLKTLFGSIRNLKNIPIELLAKYYAKALTAETDLYKDINSNLRQNIKDNITVDTNILMFIKILYESIKLNTFPIVTQNKLFRGSLLAKNEIEELKNFLKDIQGELPRAVVFSNTFLSFTKDIKIAKKFSSKKNDNPDLLNVFFILEKEENLNYNLSTHGDIEKISYFPSEKEVLFFPFSTFEVIDVDDKKEPIEIKLVYLGQKYVDLIEKYVKEIQEREKKEKEEKKKKEEEEKKKKEEEEKKKKEESKEEEKKEERKEEEKKEERKEEEKKEEEKKEETKEEEKKEEEKKEEEKKEENNVEENKEEKKENEKEEKNKIENNELIKDEIIKTEDILKILKVESFEFKTQLTKSELVKIEDITDIIDLFKKYKEYKKKLKNYHSKKKDNYIEGKITITDFYVNKDVKIIGSFEKDGTDCYSIKNEDLNKYKNEQEIKMNTRIKINGKEIKFSYYHKFPKRGDYDIKYTFKSELIKADYLFSDCKLITSLDLSNFISENVINMCGMFNNCIFLKRLDLTNFETEEVFNMSRMFYNCKFLPNLNLSYFDTKNVIDMRDMFYNCGSLQKLNLSNFITNNVNNMSNMFNGCKSLAKLNLSNFNVDHVDVMWKMFYGCISLKDKFINNKSLKLLNELKNIINI